MDGQFLIDDWTVHPPTENSATIDLGANTEYAITMEYFEAGGGAVAQLRWTPPGGADVVIPATNLIPNRDCDTNDVPDDCDADGDGDGIPDACDNCPTIFNVYDDCADALLIGEGATEFCNEDATDDGPDDCQPANKSRDIWFRYVAPAVGLLTVDTCVEQDFDIIMAVYTGACGALTLEGCDDDGCPGVMVGSDGTRLRRHTRKHDDRRWLVF